MTNAPTLPPETARAAVKGLAMRSVILKFILLVVPAAPWASMQTCNQHPGCGTLASGRAAQIVEMIGRKPESPASPAPVPVVREIPYSNLFTINYKAPPTNSEGQTGSSRQPPTQPTPKKPAEDTEAGAFQQVRDRRTLTLCDVKLGAPSCSWLSRRSYSLRRSEISAQPSSLAIRDQRSEFGVTAS